MGMVVQRHATQADAGWPNALALLSTLQRRKLRFDTVTLNAAIRAMAASGTGALWCPLSAPRGYRIRAGNPHPKVTETRFLGAQPDILVVYSLCHWRKISAARCL